MRSDKMENNGFIKKTIKKSPKEISNNFLESESEDIKYPHTYIGKVVDNRDPKKLGRCKVRVYEIFDDNIPDSDLPWAVPDFGFIGSTKGSFIVPPEKALVNVYFERDEIYLPRYTTKVLNSKQLPKDKDIDYPDNMIFFETDDGDTFQINRRKKTILLKHSSGHTIEIARNGSTFLQGSSVVPEGVGGFCALPNCLITGSPHTGRTLSPGLGVFPKP